MDREFSNRWLALPFILSLLLVLSACQPATQEPAAGNSTSTLEVVSGEVVLGPGPLTFLDTSAGLANLSSYKATLKLAFDGTRNGQAEQWSKTYVLLNTREPAARQLTIEKTGSLSDLATVFMAELDRTYYERRGESTCIGTVSETGSSVGDQLEPAGLLNGVFGAEAAGNESINGVTADHFTFDERAFGQQDVLKAAGELWLASEGSYLVRYQLTTQGGEEYFGDGLEGALNWEYELTDINQPVTIELPEDCPAARVDAPLLPDASNVVNMPGVLKYETSTSLTDASAFYQDQLISLDWTLSGKPAVMDTNVLLRFVQDDEAMTVILTAGSTGTKIHIVQSRPNKKN